MGWDREYRPEGGEGGVGQRGLVDCLLAWLGAVTWQLVLILLKCIWKYQHVLLCLFGKLISSLFVYDIVIFVFWYSELGLQSYSLVEACTGNNHGNTTVRHLPMFEKSAVQTLIQKYKHNAFCHLTITNRLSLLEAEVGQWHWGLYWLWIAKSQCDQTTHTSMG